MPQRGDRAEIAQREIVEEVRGETLRGRAGVCCVAAMRSIENDAMRCGLPWSKTWKLGRSCG
jgi:hypothetical protein